MEHSLAAYLSRRTTEELELALHSYLEEPSNEYTEQIIDLIRQVLEERAHR